MAKRIRAVAINEYDLKELAKLADNDIRQEDTISSLIQRAIREFLERNPRV